MRLPKLPSKYVRGLLVLLAIVFLYRNLNWQIDFNLHPSQLTQFEAAAKYKDKIHKEGYSLYSEGMYIDMLFGINPMEDPRHRSFHQILKNEPVPTKSLLVWESIFAGGMYKVPFDTIKNDRRFQLIDSFQHHDFIWGGTFKTFVFQTDTAYMRQLTDNKPLYINDFESTDYPNQDHSRTKQGTFIIKLDEKQPFAPGMAGAISSYFTKQEHRFKVSFDVYVEDVNQVPSVVFQTITTTGQSADWQNYTLETQVKSAHQWYSVSIIGTSRQTTDVRDVFKTYVWHPNKAAAYIDNFKVEYAD
jgi:hypothetical protein